MAKQVFRGSGCGGGGCGDDGGGCGGDGSSTQQTIIQNFENFWDHGSQNFQATIVHKTTQ